MFLFCGDIHRLGRGPCSEVPCFQVFGNIIQIESMAHGERGCTPSLLPLFSPSEGAWWALLALLGVAYLLMSCVLPFHNRAISASGTGACRKMARGKLKLPLTVY